MKIKTTLKTAFLAVLMSLLGFNALYAQSEPPVIRFGGGAQIGGSIFFPGDFKEYAFDFWDDLCSQFGECAPEAKAIFLGYSYNYRGVMRFNNLIQVEGWMEKFYGSGVGITANYYLSEYYNGSWTEQELNAEYNWSPSYKAGGLTVLLTPGAKDKSRMAFLTVGAGLGVYRGTLNYRSKGNYIVNGSQAASWNVNQDFNGKTLGYNAVLGITYAPVDFLETESMFAGRWAKAPELVNDEGDIFTNPYKGNKKVSLDFSGFEIRLGIKLMLP
ncbi:hypothetical protein HY768_04870 [candidate division TA06 bacterium]|uniref:Outer membrane protein beta-barrel domain-containing protein n=1 Tax=candidate division TA06 bacterium TaxID=2250710 RepID=A0A933MKA9_UNCT6|nr:hypothetical protein [candidate division TA06 bacterium]